MKTLLPLIGTIALSACSQPDPDPRPYPQEAPSQPVVERNLVEEPDTFEVSFGNGASATMVARPDGTFTTSLDGETVSGRMEEVDGKTCFHVEDNSVGPNCWTAGTPADDGSWIATNDGGDTVTVRPVTE